MHLLQGGGWQARPRRPGSSRLSFIAGAPSLGVSGASALRGKDSESPGHRPQCFAARDAAAMSFDDAPANGQTKTRLRARPTHSPPRSKHVQRLVQGAPEEIPGLRCRYSSAARTTARHGHCTVIGLPCSGILCRVLKKIAKHALKQTCIDPNRGARSSVPVDAAGDDLSASPGRLSTLAAKISGMDCHSCPQDHPSAAQPRHVE